MSSSEVYLRLATEPVVCASLEQIAREGARRALQKAIEDEVSDYINTHREHLDEAGRRMVVRNGSKPVREILSALGPIEVKPPRVNDRRVDENGVRFRFTSKILPPYLRKTASIEDLVPWLYLKGISTGEMRDALVHLGFDGTGLSATSVVRMTESWQQEYAGWNKRDLSGKEYVYVWADGIYFGCAHARRPLANDACHIKSHMPTNTARLTIPLSRLVLLMVFAMHAEDWSSNRIRWRNPMDAAARSSGFIGENCSVKL